MVGARVSSEIVRATRFQTVLRTIRGGAFRLVIAPFIRTCTPCMFNRWHLFNLFLSSIMLYQVRFLWPPWICLRRVLIWFLLHLLLCPVPGIGGGGAGPCWTPARLVSKLPWKPTLAFLLIQLRLGFDLGLCMLRLLSPPGGFALPRCSPALFLC